MSTEPEGDAARRRSPLHESAAKVLRDFLATTAIVEGIVIVDPRGRIIFANRTAKQMFGYAQGELSGRTIEVLVPERFHGRHDEHRRRFFAAPAERSMGAGRVIRGRRKDGSEITVEIALASASDEGEDLVVAFITDAAARRASEVQADEHVERLRGAIFEAARAEDRERKRIAAELHDRIGQALALVQIRLAALRDRLPTEARAELVDCIATIEGALSTARTLTYDLSPPMLRDLGLTAAIDWHAEQLAGRHAFEVTVEGPALVGLDADLASGLFLVVRELLANVIAHAGAPSARVVLMREGDQVGVDVSDDGAGFDPAASTPPRRTGLGLFSVRAQIAELGGTLQIASAPGAGTRVRVRVPIAAHRERSP